RRRGDDRRRASGVPERAAGHAVRAVTRLKHVLDRLYTSFDRPESAADPIQIVRRYAPLPDRELVAFIAAGLAFGRVASVLTSIENVCRVLGPSPVEFVRRFDPRADGGPLRALGHRWTRGRDFIALIWLLRQLIDAHGSLEAAFAAGSDRGAPDVGAAIEAF